MVFFLNTIVIVHSCHMHFCTCLILSSLGSYHTRSRPRFWSRSHCHHARFGLLKKKKPSG